MNQKPIIIFGNGQLADLAAFYFKHDTKRQVAGFAIDANYRTGETHNSLPLVSFENVSDHFPPDKYDMFLPISFKQMNDLRRSRFETAKNMGYQCASYVSSRATTWPDLTVGENCFIFEDNTIQPFVQIGNNCVLWSGNHIGHHSVIEDDVFITSQVVISGACHIGRGSFLGVNSSVRDETVLGVQTLVGMGAAITADTDDQSVWLAPRAVKARKRSTQIASLSHKSGG